MKIPFTSLLLLIVSVAYTQTSFQYAETNKKKFVTNDNVTFGTENIVMTLAEERIFDLERAECDAKNR